VYDVENLVSQFAWINITSMRMVGNVWDVERTDVGDVWQTLKEVMLSQY
jgi:hypothetical protein